MTCTVRAWFDGFAKANILIILTRGKEVKFDLAGNGSYTNFSNAKPPPFGQMVACRRLPGDPRPAALVAIPVPRGTQLFRLLSLWLQ